MTTHQKGEIMSDYIAYVRGLLADGRPWSTERHITSTQSPSALLTTWQNAWSGAWNLATTGLSTVYEVGTSITGYEIGTLNGTMHKVAKTTSAVTLPGTATGTGLPGSNSIVVDWTSTVTQKFGRGRMALPAPADSQVTDDGLLATPGANVKAAIQSVQNAIQADGSTIFVFPRFATQSGQPAFAKTVLTSFAVRKQLGTQRRRTRKVTKTYF
jgi:hypothetical protein